MTFQKDAEELKTENRHIPNLENDDSMTIYQTVFTTRHATGRIELRTFVSRNVQNVLECPEMSQNISSLALVCVHMHTRAHVASLNSGQYKV